MMTNVINLRDLAKLIELLVISKQVMANKITCENFCNVFGVEDELQWS
jgi:hypothetical protein